MHHGEILSIFKFNSGGVFMSINFLVIPRSDYLNEMRKLFIVMQKNEVIYRITNDERSHQVTTKWEQKMTGK